MPNEIRRARLQIEAERSFPVEPYHNKRARVAIDISCDEVEVVNKAQQALAQIRQLVDQDVMNEEQPPKTGYVPVPPPAAPAPTQPAQQVAPAQPALVQQTMSNEEAAALSAALTQAVINGQVADVQVNEITKGRLLVQLSPQEIQQLKGILNLGQPPINQPEQQPNASQSQVSPQAAHPLFS